MRKKKVSFRAEPEVKVMESYELNESSMELTTDFEKVVNDNDSLDILFESGKSNEKLVLCNTKHNEFNAKNKSGVCSNATEDEVKEDMNDVVNKMINALMGQPENASNFNENMKFADITGHDSIKDEFNANNTIKKNDAKSSTMRNAENHANDNTFINADEKILNYTNINADNSLFINGNVINNSNIHVNDNTNEITVDIIAASHNKSLIDTGDCHFIEDNINTRDLRVLVPTSRVTVENFLKTHKIYFLDKAHFAKTRRDTFSTSGLTPFALIFSHFYLRHYFVYLHTFSEFLSSQNIEREKKIESLEVVLVEPKGREIVGLKKWCREYALCEWYLLKMKWQERFMDVLHESKRELELVLEEENYEDEIQTIKKENEALRNEISNRRERIGSNKRVHVEDRINVLKNYFKQTSHRYQENFSTEQVDCMQFIAKNISFVALKDSASVLIQMLEDQRNKKQEHSKAMNKRKNELEEAGKNIERELYIYEEKYSLKNLVEKDCHLIKKKYCLLHTMHKIKVIKVRKDVIIIHFRDFEVVFQNKSTIKALKPNDVYDWGIPKIRVDRLYHTISDLISLVCLRKEIGDNLVYINMGMLEVVSKEITLIFDIKCIKVFKNETQIYEGERKDGMIKSYLK